MNDADGTAFLVGAIPGEAGLLPRTAADLLEEADGVVLVGGGWGEVRLLVPSTAEVVEFEGRSGGGAARPEAVASALARRARGGETVVCLLPGGALALSGGRLAAALRTLDVPYQVVPGTPLSVAAAEAAGVPLGGADGEPALAVLEAAPGLEVLERLSRPLEAGRATLVERVPPEQLGPRLAAAREAGLPPETPAAYLCRDGRGDRTAYVAAAGDLPARVPPAAAGPAWLALGDGVRARDRLAWRERLPLHGQRVVVTRPPGQAPELRRPLERQGASVLLCPTIRIQDPADPDPLREALKELPAYDWALFTSVNGVDRVAAALPEVDRDARDFAGVSTAAIGPSTAASLREMGLRADVVPDRYRAEDLADAVLESAGEGEMQGARVLLPRTRGAREVLPRRLSEAGAEVREVTAYVSVPPPREEVEPVARQVRDGRVDWITFTASSTVRHWVDLVGSETGGAGVAAIGPVTAGTARELGLEVDAVAEEYTIPGLVRALVETAPGPREEVA